EKLEKKYELEEKMYFYNENQKKLHQITKELKKIQEKREGIEAQIRFLDVKDLEDKINSIENLLKEKKELICYIRENFSEPTKESSVDEFYKQRIEIHIKRKKNVLFMFFTIVVSILLVIWSGISESLWLKLPLLTMCIA